MKSWWQPDALAKRRVYLTDRGRIAGAFRALFTEWGLIEVETPVLQISPGLEPNLSAFRTEFIDLDGARKTYFLHTSPEFTMKKLLVAGSGSIFQFARCFRNGERADIHHPEFTMLEWYRVGARYRDLIEDCRVLLDVALKAAGRTEFIYRGRTASPRQIEVLAVHDAFRRHADIDLAPSLTSTEPDAALLRRQAADIGVRVTPGDSWDDVFFRIFLERIEPKLGMPHPTILIDYPIHMAALARPRDDAPHLAERFELYVCGLELANAFGELTDVAEQRVRFSRDRALRLHLTGEAYPVDEDFLDALTFGMPAVAGIALGFDRLVMLATGADIITDVLWAPVAE